MKWREELPVILSGLAGALALTVSTYNVWLQRAQVQAQVWPHLQWSYTNTSEGYSWNLENVGVGPAMIRSVRVTVDGNPVAGVLEAVKLLAPELAARKDVDIQYSTFDGSVIPAGTRLHPLLISKLPENDAIVAAQAQRLRVELCYCSTLGDCWWRKPGVGEAPVKTCPTYPPFD
jgi:hypothetical protein